MPAYGSVKPFSPEHSNEESPEELNRDLGLDKVPLPEKPEVIPTGTVTYNKDGSIYHAEIGIKIQ